jgi:hypothetical protein
VKLLAEREIVDLSGDAQQRRGPAGLVDRQPTLGKLIDSEPVADNSSRPHGVADHGQHAQGKAHPILKAAAVLIVPPVAQWRHELLEQIALRAVHLHPVKPGCHYMGRSCTKAVHQVVDLVSADFMRHAAAVVARNRGRAQQKRQAARGMVLATTMEELDDA